MKYITREDPIEVLSFSNATNNCLKRTNLKTVGDVLDYPREEYIYIRSCGKKKLDEIINFLDAVENQEYVLMDTQLLDDNVIDDGIKKEIKKRQIKTFWDNEGVLKEDILIEQTDLPIRAKNSFEKAGYKYVSEIMDLPQDTLMGLRNMGATTVPSIVKFLQEVKYNTVEDYLKEDRWFIENGQELAKEIAMCSNLPLKKVIKEMLLCHESYPQAVGESLLNLMYSRETIHVAIKSKIIMYLEKKRIPIFKEEIERTFSGSILNTMILEEILYELEGENKIIIENGKIQYKFLSILEYIATIENERFQKVLSYRLAGKTLEEVGKKLDITRERVRQITNDALVGAPFFQEDMYKFIVDKYEFSKQDFMLAFDETETTYNYLNMYKRKKVRLPIIEILKDDEIAIELKKKAEKAIYKDYIIVEGNRVKKERPLLARLVVRLYCRNITKYDEFCNLYEQVLVQHGLEEETSLILDSRSYENHLQGCNYVLWNINKRFRYYNIEEQDYLPFFETLDLKQYDNVEMTTLKFFKDYPKLMEEYDIRDEYELHNLLKKICPQYGYSNISFGRMPTITFGQANFDEQVLEMLLQYAPITAVDLCEKYEEMYGVKRATVQGSYLKNISEYFSNGVYRIDEEQMPADMMKYMRKVLTADFYSLADIKRMYHHIYPNESITLINTYNLKKLGFHVYSGYVIRNTYASATDYFSSLLLGQDIIDTDLFPSKISTIVAYSNLLYSLRAEREIIEFLPKKYIALKRLQEKGVYKDVLEAYCDAVYAYVTPNMFFSVQCIKQLGFQHELEELGFEDWFYSSLLAEDKRFSYCRIGKGRTKIFKMGNEQLGYASFLTYVVEKEMSIEMYDLIELLDTKYGIKTDAAKIKEVVQDTELYYDSIMDKVYIDYDMYFEEV